jgi:prephenate dehydrogenase
MNPIQRLALIGCGLMGGSFALALRRAGLVVHVAGYSPGAATRAQAKALGVIDEDCTSVAGAVHGADVVLLAVPVGAMAESFAALRHTLADHALLMDVGSTKADVVAAASAHLGPLLPCFVPAHPIAGKEVAGIAHADAHLYQGRRTILTPLPQTGAAQMHMAQNLWAAVGSHVCSMSPQAHDAAFAAVSHLPHLLAFAAVNALHAQPQGAAYLELAGPGFKDFSRIAASDSAVWRDILSANRAQVLTQLAHYQNALAQFEATLHQPDPAALQALIQQASAVRGALKL